MFGNFGFNHGFHKRRGFGLRYWILSIASEREVTGAQIGSAISEFSGGRWSPSPGSLYLFLKELTDGDYLSVHEREGKKYYTTSQKGTALLRDSWFPWHKMSWFFDGGSNSSSEDIAEINLRLRSLKERKSEMSSSEKEDLRKIRDLIDELLD
ncbi:MAG: PadR family transcriptional regulator [Candidatus Acidifodinimicrobium sp.]